MLDSLAALLADASVANNPTLLLMAANVYALEGNFPEALKACNAVQNLELCVCARAGGGAGVPGAARCALRAPQRAPRSPKRESERTR